MKDRLANQLISYRARLACLDRPEHRAIWQDRPPLKFTEKVAEAREALAELEQASQKQQADLRGITRDKAQARRTLIEEAHWLGHIVAIYARDRSNEALASRYDLALYQWRAQRDVAVLQLARSVAQDVAALIAETPAEAADYGLTPESLAVVTGAIDAFDERLTAPHSAIHHRHRLTLSLPARSRDVKARFTLLKALVSPFGTTPEGKAFVRAYRASGKIIDAGKGRKAGEKEDAPAAAGAETEAAEGEKA
ncbi:MAG: hypothetical protein KDM64_16815 [Verrucomicrobiae bacterium]|nr:hypothetical protein [Verrucomicrobiae bacterium]